MQSEEIMIDAPGPHVMAATVVPPVDVCTKFFLVIRYADWGSASWGVCGIGANTPEEAQAQINNIAPSTIAAWRIIRVDGLPVHVPHPDKAN
jgi:hypothetical protein